MQQPTALTEPGRWLMRILFGILCVGVLGVMSLVGCNEEEYVDLCEGVDCDDGHPCTLDLCQPDSGCYYDPRPDGEACSDGACLGGVCTVLTTVSGTVTVQESLDTNSPAAGATVSVREASLSTTADEFGDFSFDVFPGVWFFESSKEDSWGFIELYDVPAEGRNDFEVVVAADAFVAQLEEALMVDIDGTKGMVTLLFEPAGGMGGETATLSEPYDFSLTFDADGKPFLSDKVIPGDEAPILTFGGVDLTEELTLTPVGVDGVNACDLEYRGAVYPVMAKTITLVDAECAPLE
jgi:hypothetical protein